MRAAMLTSHGSPLQIGSMPRPEAGEGLVLIRVKASAVNPLDPALAIPWPRPIDRDDRSIISAKDESLPPFDSLT